MIAEVNVYNLLKKDSLCRKFFGSEVYQAFAPTGTSAAVTAFVVVERISGNVMDRCIDGVSSSMMSVRIQLSSYGRNYTSAVKGLNTLVVAMDKEYPGAYDSGGFSGTVQIGAVVWSVAQGDFILTETYNDGE